MEAVRHPGVGLAGAGAPGQPRGSAAAAGTRLAEAAGDAGLLLLLVFSVPVVILAVGIPIAFFLQLLLLIWRLVV